MANFLYVDNSNVWIEGMHLAAVKKGMAASIMEAQDKKICDYSWKYDFGKLLQFAGGEKKEIGRAALYGSRPPQNDSLWNIASKSGFDVIVHDRNSHTNKEKKIDTNIAVDIIDDFHEKMDKTKDEITLVAGDKDYVPVIEKLKGKGIPFYICFWDHAARETKEVATKFISLNPYLDIVRI